MRRAGWVQTRGARRRGTEGQWHSLNTASVARNLNTNDITAENVQEKI